MLILVAVTVKVLVDTDLIGATKTAAKRWQDETDSEKTIGRGIEINGKTYSSIDQYIKEQNLKEGEILVEQVTDTTPGELAGDGTEENPYLIESIEDLIQFSNEVNGGRSFEDEYVKLAQSLDFNSELSYIDPNNTEMFGDYNADGAIKGIKEEATEKEKQGFIPIGSDDFIYYRGSSTGSFFAGTFNGNNSVIGNLYIYRDTVDDDVAMGLFGGSNGDIKNLTVTGIIECDTNDSTGDVLAGGIVGYEKGNVENCKSYVDVSIISNNRIVGYTAGIVAFGEETNIINCINYGKLNPSGSSCGGIIGNLTDGYIEKCTNNGTINVSEENQSGCDFIRRNIGIKFWR